MDKKTSWVSNSALWLGASVSVAEIMSGAYIASLGMKRGLIAIFIGHFIAGILFYMYGRIGAESGHSAMDCAALSFGRPAVGIFAGMNVLQLIVWTSIMLHVSARALDVITSHLLPIWLWPIIIGALVMGWVFVGNAGIGRLNMVFSALLLILTFLMCYRVATNSGQRATVTVFNDLSFGAAIELSLAVPLSWIPLVADYSSKAKQPHLNNVMSSLAYVGGSTWMYFIGMSAALYGGNADIMSLFIRSGIVRVLMVIVVLATMTTMYLDACSVGISGQAISKKYSVRVQALASIVIATALSIVYPVENYDGFLYLIASIFVPMTIIILVDFFILRKREQLPAIDLGTMLLWAVGFVLYHLLMDVTSFIGCTIPLIILLSFIRIVTEWRES